MVATARVWVLCTETLVGLYKMVGEILIGRLGERSLFAEIRGEITVDLRDGIRGSLGKVAQGGSAAPG